jgi:hypothetical protein
MFALCRVSSLCWLYAVTLSANAQIERLRPWASIPAGTVLAEESAGVETSWTTMYRTSRPPRLVHTLNHQWAFQYLPGERLDERLTSSGFDTKRWPAISLPHTWHTFETTGEAHPFIRNPSERDSSYWWNGWGYYRKTFILDESEVKDRRVFVEFDGVMKYCKVWCNGRYVGDHKGGYAGFYFDLTGFIVPGKTNTLAVAVNARRDDQFRIPPMTAGNFNVYGGIYRDVRIVVKDNVHIPFQGAWQHEGGTFITTPSISAESAAVRVRTWVKNDCTAPVTVTLRTTIRDPDEKELVSNAISAVVDPGVIHEFDQDQFVVPAPKLWSIENPNLYQVESFVLVGGNITDRLLSPLGIRKFEWNHAENRGYLNGRKLHIHGQNRHQEFPWLGDAIPKWIHVRDFHDMRFGQGHNFARFAHYTNDPLVYDLCDRHGMLVCQEVPNIKNIDFDEQVQRQQVIEMIRRDRNRPAVVMWSMGNETSDPADSAWAHEEDPTRIIHLRHGNRKEAGSFVTHTDKNMDMENLLRCTVRGWTHREIADFQPADGQHTGTEEWQHRQARIQGASQRGRIDMGNGVMWLYADHGADREYLNSPLKHINPKGWVDLYRIPKYMYFLWQANYTDQPVIFIHPHDWNPGNIGRTRDIVIDSNCDEVELKVNGRSYGKKYPTLANFFTVTFPGVPVENAELLAEGVKGKERTSAKLTMAGRAVGLSLASIHPKIEAERSGIAVITLTAHDPSGVQVPGFNGELEWEVTGPARLLLPSSYGSDMRLRHAVEGTFYTVAPTCVLLRSTGTPGDVTITAKSPGMVPAKMTLPATTNPVGKSFLAEMPLTDDGRETVTRARSGEQRKGVEGPMKHGTADLNFPAGRELDFYREGLAAHFRKSNPEVLSRAKAATLLIDLFAASLSSNNGLLVADDYNFKAIQFNDYCFIEHGVEALALDAGYKHVLLDHFRHDIIVSGKTVDPESELRWLKALPLHSRVVTNDTKRTLPDLLHATYPGAKLLSSRELAIALDHFRRVNQAAISALDEVPKGNLILAPDLGELIRLP